MREKTNAIFSTVKVLHFYGLRPDLEKLDYFEIFDGTNTLAYFLRTSVTKKSFIRLTRGSKSKKICPRLVI